jgi:hypothetical protein
MDIELPVIEFCMNLSNQNRQRQNRQRQNPLAVRDETPRRLDRDTTIACEKRQSSSSLRP